MKRILAILLIILTFNTYVNAQTQTCKRLTFGAEWGYVATVWSGFHYNFFSQEGYRVNDKGNIFGLHNNAEMYIHGGYDFNEKWNLSLYLGYEGIGDLHKAVPVSVRGTRYFGSNTLADRWFTFMDLGSGICIKDPVQEIFIGKLGGGYRLSLSRDTKIDFLLSLRLTYTHPEIIYDGEKVPSSMINRNNALAGAVSIGMAITL